MTNYTRFTKETWSAFTSDDRSGPIHMLNLIGLREGADYQDGRSATGKEAYSEYSRVSAGAVAQIN